MVTVPSLTGSLYLTDPQSIIALVLRRYQRTPKETIPLLDDLIISLPWQAAKYGRDPEALCNNIRSDLQNCFDRIFKGERTVTVNTNFLTDQTDTYSVSVSIIYSTAAGDVKQTGTTLYLKDGRLVIPEDKLNFSNMM